MKERSLFRPRVLGLVARIPPGKVATYGQIALLAGYPRRARHVGYALAGLPPGNDLPWHRVINAQGRISPRGGGSARRAGAVEPRQERLLKKEGVVFRKGRVDLSRYRWEPVIDESWGRAPSSFFATRPKQ
jgi:methylated-DNA-protein-cysteine methyltransferase-like protein